MKIIAHYKETLIEAIKNSHKWHDDAELLLCLDDYWKINTDAIVATVDPYDETETSLSLSGKVFERVLDKYQIIDIIDNAREQNPQCKDEDLLQAFNFYYDNDAFVVWEN